jgi:hypothetical protein
LQDRGPSPGIPGLERKALASAPADDREHVTASSLLVAAEQQVDARLEALGPPSRRLTHT